jgi:hypothetical protein
MAVQPQYGLHCCGQGEAKQRHLDWLEGERELLEDRMRELLDAPRGTRRERDTMVASRAAG